MKVSIIGSGYVGLVTAACFSDIGHIVTCVDKNKTIVDQLKSSRVHFYEKGLSKMIKKNVKSKNLEFSSSLKSSYFNSDIIMIAVGTPFKENSIDLSYIKSCAKEVALLLKHDKKFRVICVKSTVVPGTTLDFIKKIIEKNSGKKFKKDFGLASNPEFLAEGTAVKDFQNPDRVVIGIEDIKSKEKMAKLYLKYGNTDKIFTNINTAEFIKYVSNFYLAMNISFSNEISNLTNAISNVDVLDVLKGLHLDKRLSPIIKNKRLSPGLMNFIHPGVGFGGSCFPKDLKALYSFSKKNKLKSKLLKSVIDINDKQFLEIFSIAKKRIKTFKNKKILVLGLSFKPQTSDVRESPSIKIIKKLISLGARVCAHDPKAINEFKKVYTNKNLSFEKNLEKAINFSNIVFLLTSWPEYQEFLEMNSKKNTILFDGRRFIQKNLLKNYYGIGL